jgi:hypothetical protein
MTAISITAYHGTASEYNGYPTRRTDVNGLTGIFFTESFEDAEYFAEANTEGSDDGMARVFTAEIDMSEAEDLSDMDADHDEIVAAAYASDAPVVILPDMSGVSEREILVKATSVIAWK